MKKALLSFMTGIAICICLPAFSQNIGVNATGAAPDASAMLDVSAANKGLLVPRVALTSVTDATTIASPATSLLVYNTNTALTNGAGYYYNSGTPGSPVWIMLSTSMTSAGKFWDTTATNLYNTVSKAVSIGTQSYDGYSSLIIQDTINHFFSNISMINSSSGDTVNTLLDARSDGNFNGMQIGTLTNNGINFYTGGFLKSSFSPTGNLALGQFTFADTAVAKLDVRSINTTNNIATTVDGISAAMGARVNSIPDAAGGSPNYNFGGYAYADSSIVYNIGLLGDAGSSASTNVGIYGRAGAVSTRNFSIGLYGQGGSALNSYALYTSGTTALFGNAGIFSLTPKASLEVVKNSTTDTSTSNDGYLMFIASDARTNMSVTGGVIRNTGTYSFADGSDFVNASVLGETGSTGINNVGIEGALNNAPTGSALSAAVLGFDNVGISGTTYAGYFQGDVTITGNLSKGGGTFKIDHPQDPENKYLLHSFVESPDMMNVYNGNIVTDASGKATVQLPGYFEAENIDFKYQLTIVDATQFAMARISRKISGNTFEILTDKPNIEVSWQVTGVRNDKWAQAHRVVPEMEKSARDKGKYLYPELYGQSKSKGIGYVEAATNTNRVTKSAPLVPVLPLKATSTKVQQKQQVKNQQAATMVSQALINKNLKK